MSESSPTTAHSSPLLVETDPDEKLYRDVASGVRMALSLGRGSGIVDIGEWDPQKIIPHLSNVIHFSVADVMEDKTQDVRPRRDQTLVMTGYSSAFAGSHSLEEKIQHAVRSKVNMSGCASIVLSHGVPDPSIFNVELPWYNGPFQARECFSLSLLRPSALQLRKLRASYVQRSRFQWKQDEPSEIIPLR